MKMSAFLRKLIANCGLLAAHRPPQAVQVNDVFRRSA